MQESPKRAGREAAPAREAERHAGRAGGNKGPGSRARRGAGTAGEGPRGPREEGASDTGGALPKALVALRRHVTRGRPAGPRPERGPAAPQWRRSPLSCRPGR